MANPVTTAVMAGDSGSEQDHRPPVCFGDCRSVAAFRPGQEHRPPSPGKYSYHLRSFLVCPSRVVRPLLARLLLRYSNIRVSY